MATKKRPAAGPARGSAAAQQRVAAMREAEAKATRQRRLVTIAVVGVLVLAVVGIGIWGLLGAAKKPNANDKVGTPSVAFAPVSIQSQQPIFLGAANAPNTIELYTDYHCKYCKMFEDEYEVKASEGALIGQ